MILKYLFAFASSWSMGGHLWPRIICSFQNLMKKRISHLFRLIAWVALLGAVAYYWIAKHDGLIPVLLGYGISLAVTVWSWKTE